MAVSWMDAKKAALLGPMMFVMCGDSLAPGCGRSSPPPEHATFPCTMRMDGTEVPCTGEWWHWAGSSDEREIHIEGKDAAGGRHARVSLRLRSGAGPGEFRAGPYPSPDVGAETASGAYCAGLSCEGSSGTLALTTLEPPQGTYDGVLTPYGGTGHPGPPGTTVTLQISF
jgi:hypothetical protein